jgi:serine/threonine-protein kinase
VPRLVVLPLENVGPEEQAYFAVGITEEITSRLAKVRALHVLSSTTAQSYERSGKTVLQIGEDLGVDYLLVGSVRWSESSSGDSRVRVTPQLIRVADDTQVWSATYDKVIDDLFGVQTEIAEAVIRELGIVLREPEREALSPTSTRNVAAYQAYLRGMDYASRRDPNQENWQMAVQMLERSVSLDPGFAEAYAGLSEAHSQIYHLIIDHSPERLERARSAVDRALEIDPSLPAAHRALGYYYYWGHRDYDAALEAFGRAAEDLPNDSQVREGIAYIRRRQGRFDEAVRELEKALELDPESSRVSAELAQTLMVLRRYERADRLYARAIDLAPDEPIPFQQRSLNLLLWRGDLVGARRFLEIMPRQGETTSVIAWFHQELRERRYSDALARIEDTPFKVIGTPWAMSPQTLLEAQAYELMGDEDKAREFYDKARFLLERLARMEASDPRRRMPLALAYAGLGRKEEAIQQARKAVELASATPDALNGPAFLEHLAEVYARVGETEAAIEQLEELLTIPCTLSPHLLRIEPRWDPLRGEAGFEALLVE